MTIRSSAIHRPATPAWSGERLPRDEYAVGERRMMPSEFHGDALRLLHDVLRTWLPATDYVAYELPILFDPLNARRHLMPDVFVSLGAGLLDPYYGDKRDSFRLWEEAGLPGTHRSG